MKLRMRILMGWMSISERNSSFCLEFIVCVTIDASKNWLIALRRPLTKSIPYLAFGKTVCWTWLKIPFKTAYVFKHSFGKWFSHNEWKYLYYQEPVRVDTGLYNSHREESVRLLMWGSTVRFTYDGGELSNRTHQNYSHTRTEHSVSNIYLTTIQCRGWFNLLAEFPIKYSSIQHWYECIICLYCHSTPHHLFPGLQPSVCITSWIWVFWPTSFAMSTIRMIQCHLWILRRDYWLI